MTHQLMISDYGPLLYGDLGFGTLQQLLIQAGWISVCPVGNFINALVVDRLGRTKMLSNALPFHIIVSFLISSS